MKKLLITGFDPFAKYSMNPSWLAVKALPDTIGDYQLTKLLIPNIYNLEARMVLEKAAELQPEVILMTGMNASSLKLQLNIAALNIQDAPIEDNLGKRPWNQPIITNGPAAYFATIPLHEIYAKLHKSYPLQLEYGCGGYLCNDVFYQVAHHYADTSVRCGFIHIPLVPEMVWDEKDSLPLEISVATLKEIILNI